jgi:hypothetical protein
MGMNKRAKRRLAGVACIGLLLVAAFICLDYRNMEVRRHLRLLSLRGLENIRYECDKSHRKLPAYYIGFDNADAACLQKVIDRLSLEKADFFVYAGWNPPAWWPEEITGRGDREEVRRIGSALRASGDLITYRFWQRVKDPSIGKAYGIELYHYPGKKRTFYVKRWVALAVP